MADDGIMMSGTRASTYIVLTYSVRINISPEWQWSKYKFWNSYINTVTTYQVNAVLF